MAKLNRERKLLERRMEKQAKKQARRQAAASDAAFPATPAPGTAEEAERTASASD